MISFSSGHIPKLLQVAGDVFEGTMIEALRRGSVDALHEVEALGLQIPEHVWEGTHRFESLNFIAISGKKILQVP